MRRRGAGNWAGHIYDDNVDNGPEVFRHSRNDSVKQFSRRCNGRFHSSGDRLAPPEPEHQINALPRRIGVPGVPVAKLRGGGGEQLGMPLTLHLNYQKCPCARDAGRRGEVAAIAARHVVLDHH